MTTPRKELPVLAGETPAGARPMTPLQAELLEDGTLPEPDALGARLWRADMAPEAGYTEGGPPDAAGPYSAGDQRWTGSPPVFQWEIDPADPALESHEAHIALGDWEYSVWWQRHHQGLLYASLQALHRDDVARAERAHPLGRNVVVNLVYDEQRQGVVAIYGTARDFRPFVHAFGTAAGLTPHKETDV